MEGSQAWHRYRPDQRESRRRQPGGEKPLLDYKVDRLTRSLADFAKLVDLFDAHDVSFVSVTQQFNTTCTLATIDHAIKLADEVLR